MTNLGRHVFQEPGGALVTRHMHRPAAFQQTGTQGKRGKQMPAGAAGDKKGGFFHFAPANAGQVWPAAVVRGMTVTRGSAHCRDTASRKPTVTAAAKSAEPP